MLAFGNELRSKRKSLGLSTREVAAETGMDHVNIWQYERGSCIPRFDRGIKLCKLLNIDMTKLVFEKPQEPIPLAQESNDLSLPIGAR